MGNALPPVDYTTSQQENTSVTLTVSGNIRTDLTSKLEVVTHDASELPSLAGGEN